MNAAARAIHESNVFNGSLFELRISKQTGLFLLLSLLVLGSALAVVYAINDYRMTFAYSQQLEHRSQSLEVQWGQLLLERASLARAARVERLAVEQLNMHRPSDKQTFLLKAR